MPRSTQNYGIDTSVFVRLLTGHPEADFEQTTKALKRLHNKEPAAELVVSNQVIGEAYVTLQHHYGITKTDAREAISVLLQSGMIRPLNGSAVIALLNETRGAGLMDRLIAQDYNQQNAMALTNDKRMSKLEGVRLL